MDISLNNITFWVTLAFWATTLVTLSFVLARWAIKKPRYRAGLILATLLCALIPFVANYLPANPIPGSLVILDRPSPLFETKSQTAVANAAGPLVQSALSKSEPAGQPFDWIRAFIMVWLFGTGFGLTLLVRQVLKMNRVARRGHADAPMVAGFPVARIVLPGDWPGTMSAEEAEAALAHEQVHLRHLHVQGRVFVELFRCLFWWLPTIHFTAKLYEQCLEEIADLAAISRVKPEALANALVKAAQLGHRTNPSLATGATSNGKHLEVRLKLIMEKQNPGRWPFAILIAVATIGVAFAAAPQSDIGQQIEQQAVGLHPIYGLAKGSSWTYEISNGKLKETYDWTVSKATKDGKYTVYELTRRLGTSKIFSFSYQGLLGNDLYDVGSAGMGGPGYTLSAVEPIMKKPLVIGATWKWNRPFRGQTMSGPDGKAPDMSSLAQDCVATIEGEEIVTVGAGKFRCYRIHVVRTSRAYGTHETTEWISLQAGLVKREYKPRPNEPGGTEELVKFTAGSSLPG